MSSTYYDRVIASAPDVYWRLLDTSGSTAVDDLGGVDATLSGDYQLNHVLGSVRANSYCTYFNGGTAGAVADSNSVGDFSVTQAFTIEFWLDQWYISNIIKKHTGSTGWQIRGNGTSSPIVLLSATGVAGSKTFGSIPSSTPGAPRHFVFTYDGSATAAGLRFFHDGVELAGSGTWNLNSSSVITNTLPVTMFGDGGVGCFMECAIYSRALSVDEVIEHASPGLSFNGRYDASAHVLRSVSRPAKNLITTTSGSSTAAKGGGRLNPRIG